jgi:hypothetical protein
MLLHDWLLTGDPLFWTKIAELNSVGAANIRGPLQIAVWLAHHLIDVAPLVLLAALGAAQLIRRRWWPVGLGLLALGPGVAGFLVFLGLRGVFVSERYLASIDLALVFTAGLGLSAVDVPTIRRRLGQIQSVGRLRFAVPMLAGAIAALALAPSGLTDGVTRQSIGKQVRLHANEQRAMAVIRTELAAPTACFASSRASTSPDRAAVIVPSRLRVQAVVDLGLGLDVVTKPGGLIKVDGVPSAGQIIYHDRLDGQTGAPYAIYEINAPVVKGAVRLVPLLADAKQGEWVIRVDDASC